MKLPNIAYTPDERGEYSILPSIYEPIRKKHRHEQRYQIWSHESTLNVPVLLAEYYAPNDKIAKKYMANVLAVKVGQGEADDLQRAKIFLQWHKAGIKLKNADTQKEIHLRETHINLRDLKKLAHIA